jgi:putative transposase
LPTPLTITTDGAPGVVRAVTEQWPISLRLRCWHEVKGHLVGIRDAATLEAGEQAVADFLARYGAEFESACACLQDDLDALLNLLRLPWRLRKFLRTTNLCERSFVEERRRSKTLPRFFTEKSCLKLVFATLIRAAERWQRIVVTRLELEQSTLLYQECGLTPALQAGQVAWTRGAITLREPLEKISDLTPRNGGVIWRTNTGGCYS